jgi:hypothetical protein
MRLHYLILVIFFSVIASKETRAQRNYSIHGSVTDTAGNPVNGATIKWKDPSSNDSLVTTSDVFGKFIFPKVKTPEFQLVLTSVGFDRFSKLYSFPAGKYRIDIGNMTLRNHYASLDEVTVSGRTPAIVFKEDTIEYKADSFRLKRKDAVLEDLLKKLPGIQVKKDGTVIAQGKVVARIKVNGKDFFDGDITTATQNLPANIVDKVQVIDDYGDAASFTGFKGSEPQKIINIQLKKDKNQGYFVRCKEGYGPDNKYSFTNTANYFDKERQISAFTNNNNSSGSSLIHGFEKPFFGSMTDLVKLNNNAVQDLGGNNGLSSLVSNQDFGFLNAIPNYGNGVSSNSIYGVRYSDQFSKKISFYASGMYYRIDNRLQYKAGGLQLIDADNTLSQSIADNKHTPSSGQRIYTNIEYRPDSLLSIKLTPVLTFQHIDANEAISDTNIYKGSPLSYSYSNNQSGMRNDLYAVDLLIKKRFKKTRQSLLLEVNYYNNKSLNTLQTYNTFTSVVNDTVNQLLYTKSNSVSMEDKLLYTVPFPNKQLVEFYYDYSASLSSASRTTYFHSDSSDIFLKSPAYSGAITSDIYSQLLGFNYKWRHKKMEYVLGFGWQDMLYHRKDSVASGDVRRNAVNLLPQAQFNYQISGTQVINFKYSGIVQPPNPLLLLPVTDTSNPLIIYKGNIDLKPEFRNSATLYYYYFDLIKGKLVLTGLTYNKTFNKIIPSIALNDIGKTVISYINTGYSSDIGAYYNFSQPFLNKKYEITLGGNIYDATYAFYNNGAHIIHSLKFNQNLEFIFNRDWGEFVAGAGVAQTNFLMEGNMHTARDYSLNQRSNFYFGNLKAGWDLSLIRSSGYFLPTAGTNIVILNAYIEQGLTRKLFIRLDANDLFDRSQFNYNRSTHDNYITDYRFNVIGRYVLLSFIFKLNRFGAGSH